MTKVYGIYIDSGDGTWMKDKWLKDENDEWYSTPALYKTLREAKEDARLFTKDSKYKYIAKEYEETS